MDEPSTSTSASVARSEVRKSDEEQARLLGLPPIPPYEDNDTSSPMDLTETMKLRISYRQLERLIKIFETINRGIKTIKILKFLKMLVSL